MFSSIKTVQSEAVNPEALTPFIRVGVLCAGDEEFMADPENVGRVERAIQRANNYTSIWCLDCFELTFGLHFEVVGWVTWDSDDNVYIASLMAAEVWTETGFKTGMVVNGQFVHMLCACTGQDIEGYLAVTFPNANITLIEELDSFNGGVIRHEFSHQFHCPDCDGKCVMNVDYIYRMGPCHDWCPNCKDWINTHKYKWSEPVCAMKTKTDDYFYVPSVATDLLKIEMLFDNQNIVGDQIGGTSPYSTITAYPDGKVDIRDVAFVSNKYGLVEGRSGWDYMADVYPDRKIDIQDIARVSANFGKFGTYITSFAGVTVTFNTGQTISPDSDGFVTIPQGTTNFTVKRNGNPIGAMIIFW